MIELYEWFMSLSAFEMIGLLFFQLVVTLGLREITSDLA